MQYGICLLSVVPGRKDPSNTSEMVTQLLFGECYSVIDQNEEWLKILIADDRYECWINSKQHRRITESIYSQLQKNAPYYSSSLFDQIQDKSKDIEFIIPAGSRLPYFSAGKISFDNLNYQFDGNTVKPDEKGSAAKIVASAKKFINSPYLWGGKTAMGMDCSGFTQLVFKLNGHLLPRDASQQVELGVPLNFVEEAEAGDLAFFDNEEGRIIHVGILLDNESIIHASGCVRIDRFDHYGIHNSDTRKYTHTLRVIKRIL